jgi:hypothetical protein
LFWNQTHDCFADYPLYFVSPAPASHLYAVLRDHCRLLSQITSNLNPENSFWSGNIWGNDYANYCGWPRPIGCKSLIRE